MTETHATRRFAARLIAAAAMLSCIPAASAADLTNLRCEYLADPLGIDVARPRLSWIIADSESEIGNVKSEIPRGQKQTAYQVLVASTPELLARDQGDLWDSGKVVSDQSIQVEYAGKPLKSRMQCCWKVRVWDKDGKVSPWSGPARWMMGLLKPEDWQGKWITWGGGSAKSIGHPWIRRNFEVGADVKSARVYVNTPSLYELFINGKRVGDDVLMPAYCQFKTRVFYNVLDVSHLLHKGTNCMALWMGPGWHQAHYGNPYKAPIVRAQLEIDSLDGQSVIGTDGQWRAADSCISQVGGWAWNNFGGERYDDGKCVKDWNLAAYADSAWTKAMEVAAPNVTTSWQALPGNRTGSPIPAKNIYPHKDKWIIDFGTTLTGWMRLRLDGLKPGKEVVIDYADMLDPQLMFMHNADGFQTFNQRDVYVAGNAPTGVFHSRFNQHGFRYAIISGLGKAPEPADAEAMMVQTELEKGGEFVCSNELFNRIHEITVYTYRTQIPCGVLGGGEPREKEGYGDGGSFLSGMLYNFRSDAFFVKWLRDWRDNQRPDGYFGNTAPAQRSHGGGPSWGGQASELVRRLYLYYGDKTIVADAYPALKKYVEYLESHTEGDILRYFNPFESKNPTKFVTWQFLGDWTPPTKSADRHKFEFETMDQREFFNNCYRILLWQDLADFAGVLGDTAEKKRCEERLAVLRALIHKTYFDAGKNSYRVNRQAYLVIALRARIMPEQLRSLIFRQLEEDIVVTRKGHLDVGLQGSFMLLDLLIKENRSDLAALIMGQDTYPGWGYLVKERKVTTWPETWSGWGSQIIQVVGTPGAWFYQGLAGIRPDESGPGFKKIIVKPAVVGDLTWVKCGYDSIHGRIVSNWKREGGKLTMEITIPANTTATVHVPARDAAGVTESGKPADKAEGVKFMRMENGAAIYEVGCGTYRFQSTLPETVR